MAMSTQVSTTTTVVNAAGNQKKANVKHTDINEMVPFYGCCCFLCNIYAEFPDCLGITASGECCCTRSVVACCKARSGDAGGVCCDICSCNSSCIKPQTCCFSQCQCCCIDYRGACPAAKDAPCIVTPLPYCVVYPKCGCCSKIGTLRGAKVTQADTTTTTTTTTTTK